MSWLFLANIMLTPLKTHRKDKRLIEFIKNKAIAMMRRKSPPSEIIFRNNQVEQLLIFFKEVEKEIISLLSKYYFV